MGRSAQSRRGKDFVKKMEFRQGSKAGRVSAAQKVFMTEFLKRRMCQDSSSFSGQVNLPEPVSKCLAYV